MKTLTYTEANQLGLSKRDADLYNGYQDFYQILKESAELKSDKVKWRNYLIDELKKKLNGISNTYWAHPSVGKKLSLERNILLKPKKDKIVAITGHEYFDVTPTTKKDKVVKTFNSPEEAIDFLYFS